MLISIRIIAYRSKRASVYKYALTPSLANFSIYPYKADFYTNKLSLFHFHLPHHTIVLMFKNMTVEHIHTLMLKLDGYFHSFIRFDGNTILPSPFIFRWGFSVS